MGATETIPESTTDDLRRVTAAASRAAAPLAATDASRRGAFLAAAADAIDAATDELVAIAEEETALGADRLRGEVARTTGQLRLFATVLDDGAWLEATIDHADPASGRPDIRRQLEPLGPVAVFSASNFPFAFSVAGGDTASALAAGCPVVVKAHSGHPRTSASTAEVLRRALTEAGAPDGTFDWLIGRQVGRDLVLDPAIRAVGFTGSVAGGRALHDLATGRPDPIPFYGELGSINPVVVTAGAARARAAEIAEGLVGSFTMGVGQFCTKPGLVFVPRDGGIEDGVVAAVGGATGGRMLTERMASGFHEGLAALAGRDHVEVLAGPARQDGDVGTPTVLVTDASHVPTDDLLVEECFGPAVLLLRYDEDTLGEALDALPGSLTGSVHLADDEVDDVADLFGQLRDKVGRIIVNGWPTGVAVTWSMHHGGPWPATTNALHTSVGTTALRRFVRPVAYQDVPDALLPPALREGNPLGVPRRVDGRLQA